MVTCCLQPSPRLQLASQSTPLFRQADNGPRNGGLWRTWGINVLVDKVVRQRTRVRIPMFINTRAENSIMQAAGKEFEVQGTCQVSRFGDGSARSGQVDPSHCSGSE